MIQAWIQAFRLRTLPLALSSIGMAGFLVASKSAFRTDIFLLCVFTTIFLQVLSNLANDYGDTVHGADSDKREGPKRAVQMGIISASQMKKAMYLFAVLSFSAGLYLLSIASAIHENISLLFFLLLGCLSIAAAIKYTAGNNPYGYSGFGDIAVLLFFGLVGVIGTTYLFLGYVEYLFLLPAFSCGFFATAVLNVNNIRDIESDKDAGKRSIPVRIGRKNARIYHWSLLLLGISCSLLFAFLTFENASQWLFIITFPLFIRNGLAISKFQKAQDLDPFLKQMAISTLLFVLLFGVSILL